MDGTGLYCVPVVADGVIYGSAQHSGDGYGTLFKLNTDGSGYTVLKSFAGDDGAFAGGGLVLSGNMLYGTTSWGGTNDYGTVFALDTNGGNFTLITQFTGNDANAYPTRLLLSGGTLYVIANSTPGYDTGLFKVNIDGSGYTMLKNFTNELDGAYPYPELGLAGSTLFGVTTWGGIFGYGTVFQINTDGSGYAVLSELNSDIGNSGWGGMTLSGSSLYATTCDNGATGGGALFSVSLSPDITANPPSRTVEAGSNALLRVKVAGAMPLSYQWLCNNTNPSSGCWTNVLELSDLQCADSGTPYVLVITNAFGSTTTAPVVLSVIPPVERRPVPALNLTGTIGSSLNIEYPDDLASPANWVTLDTVELAATSQFYFDITDPLPPWRFYRAWQAGTPAVVPSLNLPGMVPAITLTGNVGDSVQLDYINAIGPTNAWVALDTVTFTNTSQLYFDASCLGQPERLYRIVPVSCSGSSSRAFSR
jgi:uncharacterized repeat protein (TIGR03803 family)